MSLEDFLNGLTAHGNKITLDEARQLANENGYTNQNGDPYTSNRGFAHAVSTSYDKLEQSGNSEGAKNLANGITDKNGNFAWDK